MAASKKKTEFVQRLIAEVEPRHPLPSKPLEGANLLEQGAVIVLMRRLTENQAEASVKAIQAHFGDWNEVRVSQAQEIASCFKTSSRKKGPALLNDMKETALLLKDYLQDVFQQTHHLDLEELREDEAAAGKVLASLGVLGMTGAAYVMWVARERQIPVHLPLARLLDRLGIIPRTQSLKKARESIESIVPKGQEIEFTIAIHEVLARWDDNDEPIYASVSVVGETPAGKKALKERETALAKAEAQRLRDEERQRKEEERAQREAERERKRAEAAEAKRQRDEERKRAKAVAAAQKEAAKKEAAKKKAAAKKAATKKAATKKAATKKAASKKAATKKAASKKSATKKAPSKKKAATNKTGTKKPAAKKKAATSKPAAKKKVSRRR